MSAKTCDTLPPNAEIITDLDRAMLLENAQDLPDGYRIWPDVVSGAVSGYYSTAAAREGRGFVDAEGQRIWESCGESERALKIKRVRKTITPFEEFWLTVAYDLFEMLKSVSLGRHVLGRETTLFWRPSTPRWMPDSIPADGIARVESAPLIRVGWMASGRSGERAAMSINKMSC